MAKASPAKYADLKLSQVTKELKKTYRQAQNELKEKLADFNAKFAEKSREKKKQLAAGEITEKEYKDWLTGQVFIRSQFEQNLRQVNAVMLDHNRQAMNLINNGTIDTFAEAYNFEAFKCESAMIASFNVYNAQAVARLMLEEPDLLPKWKIDEEKDYVWNASRVNNIIRQGIIQGEGVSEITDRLCEGLSTSNYKKMLMFARTALGSAQEAGRQKQMDDLADMGVKVMKRWLATLDGVTRDTHRALDNVTIPYNEHFDNGLMFPKDPSGAAREIFNCRCTMRTFLPDYDDPNDGKWRENEIIDGQTYEEWKKGKVKKGEVQPGFDDRRDKMIEEIREKLAKNCFNGSVPDGCKDAIIESLNRASDQMLEIVNKTADKVNIEWKEKDQYHPSSCYWEHTGSIQILTHDAVDEVREVDDLLHTFWHEYGHFVDDAAISGSGYGYKSEYGDYFFHGIKMEAEKDDQWGIAAAKDTQAFLERMGLADRYECRYASGNYSAGLWHKDGDWIDSRHPSFETMTELEHTLEKWAKGFTGHIYANEYLEQQGYPVRPDRSEYYETYYTPKRKLFREREKFKGAGEEYQKTIREFYDQVDKFESTHDMRKLMDEWEEINKKVKHKEEMIRGATDTFDGGVNGSFSAFISLGGHTPDYYSVNKMGLTESVANVFCTLMLNDEDMTNAMLDLCPNTFNLIKGVILK